MITYLIKSSNNKLDNWQDATDDQKTFMNKYIEIIKTKEKHEVPGVVDEINKLSGYKLNYVSCNYLEVPDVPFYCQTRSWPLGFYTLKSKEAETNGYGARIICVYGIEPNVDDLYKAVKKAGKEVEATPQSSKGGGKKKR